MSEAQPDPGHLEFLDRLVGAHPGAAAPAVAVPTFALYARVSTEDLQDPEGSLARQVGLSLTSWIDEEDPNYAGLPIDLPRATDDVVLPRVDGQLLRSLPAGGIIAALREQMRLVLSQERDMSGKPEEWRQSFAQWREENAADREAFNSNRRGRDLGDDHYREVAAVYAQAVQAGLSPTVAVAEHFTVEKTSAAKKVSRARARGFLPKTTRGRVGPLTTEL